MEQRSKSRIGIASMPEPSVEELEVTVDVVGIGTEGPYPVAVAEDQAS